METKGGILALLKTTWLQTNDYILAYDQIGYNPLKSDELKTWSRSKFYEFNRIMTDTTIVGIYKFLKEVLKILIMKL